MLPGKNETFDTNYPNYYCKMIFIDINTSLLQIFTIIFRTPSVFEIFLLITLLHKIWFLGQKQILISKFYMVRAKKQTFAVNMF